MRLFKCATCTITITRGEEGVCTERVPPPRRETLVELLVLRRDAVEELAIGGQCGVCLTHQRRQTPREERLLDSSGRRAQITRDAKAAGG